MLAIVVSACLMTDIHVCRTESIPVWADVDPMRCMIGAAPRLAQWSEEHPQWRVTRWTCRPATQQDI